jgi:hypothetical protein
VCGALRVRARKARLRATAEGWCIRRLLTPAVSQHAGPVPVKGVARRPAPAPGGLMSGHDAEPADPVNRSPTG